jgi:CHC2 zinc finger/DnaB-like helicase C terminal domain
MNRDEIISDHPLLAYCEALGWEIQRDGAAGRFKCLCPFHAERTPSCTVYADEDRFHCFGCGADGTVIDLHAHRRGIPVAEAMRELSRDNADTGRSEHKPNGAQPHGKAARPQKEVAAYDYHNATGELVYQVVRFEPKDFRQCRIVDGRRIWNMDGIERLPYRLPELLSGPLSVWICEGEKDVETLRAINQTATTNPGGAGKWLPAFSQYLGGQHVYIVPDNDETGQKHAQAVLKSLEGIVEWAKWLELPRQWEGKPVKDISDLREACETNEAFFAVLEMLQRGARLIERGVESEFRTVAELEELYAAEAINFRENSLDLTKWLPSINVRPLGPGALLGVVAGTGSLKTASIFNILRCNPDLRAAMFQLELTGPDTFERVAAMDTGYTVTQIQDIYRAGERIDWRGGKRGFRNLIVCNRSITIGELDEKIARASAKLGCTPQLVIVDYLQLIRGPARTRYERLSEACEVCRQLANKHHTIGVIVSQTSRPTEEGQEVQLFDAKETGSFENSCSVVLALWKTGTFTMRCAVRKNSKGYSGKPLDLKITDGTYAIEEA